MRSLVILVAIISTLHKLECAHHPKSRLNFFDIDLLRYAVEDKEGNVMVSPVSLRSTLAMLLEGADDETANEIITALRLSPVKEDYRRELRQFQEALETHTPNVILNNVNGLFVTDKLKLNSEYESNGKKLYNADIFKLNFDDSNTAKNTINKWVTEKTKGLIPSIVDQVHTTPKTELLLTNALYFKSAWLNSFQPELTHPECFYKYSVCEMVSMMDLDARLKYAFVRDLRAHALELPYQNDRYSMIVLVPQDREAGVALIRDLPYIGLPDIYSQMEPTDVILSMPKFTVDYGEDMVETLKKMHITKLFSANASLSGIFQEQAAHIDSLYHMAHLSVDEVGTVAAAASAAMVIPLINNQVQLRIDRPFLFFIRDNHLGLVLFEGKIENPTEFSEPQETKDCIESRRDKNEGHAASKVTSFEQTTAYPKPAKTMLKTTRRLDFAPKNIGRELSFYEKLKSCCL